MMTCASGEARCQEKKLHWKNALPTETYIAYNKDALRSSKSGIPNLVKEVMSGLLQMC